MSLLRLHPLSTPNWRGSQLHQPHVLHWGQILRVFKGSASRIYSSRIGSAIVFVRRNVQHRDLKLPRYTRFALITIVMVVVSIRRPTSCPVRPPPLSCKSIQPHEKNPRKTQGKIPTISLALGTDPKGKGIVKGKASRIQSMTVAKYGLRSCMYAGTHKIVS